VARISENPTALGSVHWERAAVEAWVLPVTRSSGEFGPAASRATIGTRELEPQKVLTTLLCTDIAESTRHAAELGDREWLRLLDIQTAATRRAVECFRGTVFRDTGDGILASFDAPKPALACAVAAIAATRKLGLELRAGLHTGECQVVGDDLRGLLLHVTARVCAVAEPGEVLITQRVRDVACGSLEFAERGSCRLRGLPGRWPLFTLAS
jgi:class 3 adenylate cyclase